MYTKGSKKMHQQEKVTGGMSQQHTQHTKLLPNGHFILAGDFSANINIIKNHQAIRNDRIHQEILNDQQLSSISAKQKQKQNRHMDKSSKQSESQQTGKAYTTNVKK